MIKALLIQLPVPQLNFGRRTGNIPFAAACLQQAADHIPGTEIIVYPQISASYMGDTALIDSILAIRADIIGFTSYVWNIKRILHLVKEIKKSYSPKVVLGGPEVTADNAMLVNNSLIDFCVYGEGERIFAQLLTEPEVWLKKRGQADAGKIFSSSRSPYLSGILNPSIENSMLLETMRGCTYACSYCYYGKARKRALFKADTLVTEGFEWAVSNDVKEVYFLDPSFNARPDLPSLLKRLAKINKEHNMTLISEIRGDSVDDGLAALLADAGFKWFEIGLQSTNTNALRLMNRKTDLNRFIKGIEALKNRGITTEIDLILGLPGDDMEGFKNTLKFIIDNNLGDDIQLFPLSILPGTGFRRDAERLGITYDKIPPYTVLSTNTFTEDEMLDAFIEAEKRLEVSFYPMPDIDLSFRGEEALPIERMADVKVRIDDAYLYCKVWLHRNRTMDELKRAARGVTHPYQLMVPPSVDDHDYVLRALSLFTEMNPHTPCELVFFDPPYMTEVPRLLEASHIDRPHYLDGHLRPLYYKGGNRAILFTVVSSGADSGLSGEMQRHVYWWQAISLPDKEIINRLESQGFDGILIDSGIERHHIQSFQDKMADEAGDLIHITFSRLDLNRRWLIKTMPGDYCPDILPII
ncbi:MAG: radical SAM protein [Deltaproteobacteria bacterium]|nr:radical SAM protein [Deltaproteobacteria bacterium]